MNVLFQTGLPQLPTTFNFCDLKIQTYRFLLQFQGSDVQSALRLLVSKMESSRSSFFDESFELSDSTLSLSYNRSNNNMVDLIFLLHGIDPIGEILLINCKHRIQ